MKIKLALIILLNGLFIQAQDALFTEQSKFTHQDTLRGSITPERSWWNLTFYDLHVNVNINEQSISGKNNIHYTVLKPHQQIQIDLQAPLKLTKATQDGQELKINHDGNAHFIELKKIQIKGHKEVIEVFFSGKPKVAKRPPWDGGITWKKDTNGNAFIASACQGIGASIWWPNKDHMYDEVDSMAINITTPKHLIDVSNGRLRKVTTNNKNKTYHWFVKNPINNYGVNINIGDYIHFSDEYLGENGPLTLDYYVLKDNLYKAKNQFKQTNKMLKAFEYWFGPYPFYEDGFKLVEVPYLGMEHQSSVTYGNGFKNGYLGRDLSGTGWGLKFDFIIIHEAGHEWFANNITNKDVADMWIHESFAAYSENLYLDYYYGKQAAAEYVIGTRRSISNSHPIIGVYGVNKEGSSDMYYKGANMLHTLRQLIENDKLWQAILRGLNKTFYHQTVTTKQIEDYISTKSCIDLSAFFNQYLRDTRIPTLEYRIKKDTLYYKWINIVEDFDMPIQVEINGDTKWLFPKKETRSLKLPTNHSSFTVDPDFYVLTKRL